MKKNLMAIMAIYSMLMVFGLVGSVNASSFTELGDAGELLPTANITVGSGNLTSISGSLIDIGTGVDDIDLYKISIVNTDAFSVTTSASLSEDNDAMLFLFDAVGSLLLFNDDASDDDYLPGFSTGSLAGTPVGIFYLAFDLYDTTPTFTSSGSLSGWNRDPYPFQTGDYTLSITGAEFSAVPIPAAIWLFGSGLLGLFGIRKRTKMSAVKA